MRDAAPLCSTLSEHPERFRPQLRATPRSVFETGMNPPTQSRIEEFEHPIAAEARALLRQSSVGTLCTLSQKHDGWPFASLTPYALDERGFPMIFVARIAQHTLNMDADARVSLMTRDLGAAKDGDDPQAHGRVTWMGRAEPVEIGSPEEDVLHARYLLRVPDADRYRAMHSFRYYRLTPYTIRYIGGFGKIHWISASAMTLEPSADPLAKDAQYVIDHMNSDHADALMLLCNVHHGFDATDAKMVSVDQFGFDVVSQAHGRRVRMEFDEASTPDTVRNQVVAMVRAARASQAQSA